MAGLEDISRGARSPRAPRTWRARADLNRSEKFEPDRPRRIAGGESELEASATRSSANAASSMEDRVLIELARMGDEAAFEKLVEKYRARTMWIARGFVLDDESARDVAQEAFLRLYQNLHRYDPRQRFYTWYYRIVVHLSIDYVRRGRRRPRRILPGDEAARAERSSPADAMELAELRQQVRAILETVPVKYRALLVLRDLEGFTSKEIADIFRCNHATARWRLHRARKLFRAAWEEAGFPAESI